MIRFLTGGESHGPELTAVVEGLPAGLELTACDINRDLRRRQKGYGRGGRMEIESDTVQIMSGVRGGKTLGSPITLRIENRDWENWREVMDTAPRKGECDPLTRPRPGHADLAGALKYGHRDLRNVLERASARETAIRVAVGAICRRFLADFGVEIIAFVAAVGSAHLEEDWVPSRPETVERIFSKREVLEDSPLRCPDVLTTEKMIAEIKKARKEGDSLGGSFYVVAQGLPVGLGSHVHWDRRLDSRLAAALMGIPAIKGTEIGLGFEASRRPGSKVHDPIYHVDNEKQDTAEKGKKSGGFFHLTNNAGGLEGGITNGEPVWVRAAMKPIPTLYTPLRSADIRSYRPFEASVERSDVCAVPSAAVVGEAVSAIELASAFCEKFGGDAVCEMKKNYTSFLDAISS